MVTIFLLTFAGALFLEDLLHLALSDKTVEDTDECDFARAVKKRGGWVKVLSVWIFFFNPYTFFITFAKVKSEHELLLPRALAEGPLNRKMCRCLFFF